MQYISSGNLNYKVKNMAKCIVNNIVKSVISCLRREEIVYKFSIEIFGITYWIIYNVCSTDPRSQNLWIYLNIFEDSFIFSDVYCFFLLQEIQFQIHKEIFVVMCIYTG